MDWKGLGTQYLFLFFTKLHYSLRPEFLSSFLTKSATHYMSQFSNLLGTAFLIQFLVLDQSPSLKIHETTKQFKCESPEEQGTVYL